MRHTRRLIYLLLFIVTVESKDVKSKFVNTGQGPVKGYKDTEWNLYAFHGIPYATMPMGKNKFKPPLPAPSWNQTFEAVRQNIFCPQAKFIPVMTVDKENCLLANVFVPDTEETNLPVVVYVHGGAYSGGVRNALTPYGLVQKGNIIAVNFNYRVGVHGFLCLGTEDVPGNAGMKDQVAALRWVKQNIANFGGNPNDISLAGYSAGSSAVELLMLSETTIGLFNKVIPESGAGVGIWSVQSDPLALAKRLARQLNFTNVDDVYALEEFLKTASFELLSSQSFFVERDSTFGFEPCVERDTGSEMFFRESPFEIMRKGNYQKLPLLIGFANMEGLMRAPFFATWKGEMNTDFSNFVPGDLQFGNKEQKKDVANKIKKFYFGDKPVNDDTVQGFIDFFGDVMFNYLTMRSVRLQIEAGNKNVYLYEFSYVDERIVKRSPLPHIWGATHCAQSGFTLELPIYIDPKDIPPSEYDIKMESLMKQLWINFIKTSKPVPKPTSTFPDGWPAVSSDRGSPYMNLNLLSKLHKTPLLDKRTRFWDQVYDKHYRIPIPPLELPPKRSDL